MKDEHGFKYKLTEIVCHAEAPKDVFTIIRRWLDVDMPEGENRHYMLRRDKVWLGSDTFGPVAEAELMLAVVT